uniref:Pre-mRNA-splicing factor SPF27 n=1 Tax=Oryza meridionalis TaxID=40149 RepID=A0A0E0C0D1_9ORYZ
MASSSGTREVLMLEAPPAPSGAPWRAPPDAEVVDALPYIDGDYGDPAVKREVDRMVEEEMRRGSRKPADFLRDLPPVPAIGIENLELMLKYGVEVWKLQNRQMESVLSRMQKMAVEYNEKIETVNRERKFHQQNTGGQLHALTTEWQELCQKNIAIQAACVDLQNQIDQLKLGAEELGMPIDDSTGTNQQASSAVHDAHPLQYC